MKNFHLDTTEIIHILVSVLTVSVAFAIVQTCSQRPCLPTFTPDFFAVVGMILVTVGSGFILHELAHKYVATRYGAYARYQAWTLGLLFAVVLAVTVGFVFAAPGAVYIYGHNLPRDKNGKISLAGPATNLVLGFLFLALALLLPTFAHIGFIGAQVNFFLGAFNMLPFFPMDGQKVWVWNKGIWAAFFVPLVLLAFGGGGNDSMKKKATSKIHKSHPHGKLIIGVVAVLLALGAISFTGGSLTGAYHIRGGADRLYASDITFIPETDSFSVYIPGRGLVATDITLYMKVRVANASFTRDIGLGFKFDPRPGYWTDTAWVVVKNLTSRDMWHPEPLLTGSVIYYNGSNYVLAQEGGYYRDDWHGLPAWDFIEPRLPLYFVNSSGNVSDCSSDYLRIAFEPHRPIPVPRAVLAQIEEYNLLKPIEPSWWLVKWKPFHAGLSLTGVYYQPSPRQWPPDQVRVGFVADTGSSFIGSGVGGGGARIRYVYDASSILHVCPIPLPPG